MKSPVLACGLSLIIASVLATSAAAQELCDASAMTTAQALKEEALADLQALKDEISADSSLGPLSAAFITLDRAIDSLKAGLRLFTGVGPCIVTADDAETLFNALDFEEIGIELVMDLRSEASLPDGPRVDTAEAAVKKTLAGNAVLVLALLPPEQLPADGFGSSSEVFDLEATKEEVQTAPGQCALPPPSATRENDGTCDDALGDFADVIEAIFEISAIIEIRPVEIVEIGPGEIIVEIGPGEIIEIIF